MKALDLYACCGGSSDGLARAGFEVTGVEIDPKCEKYYPYTFVCQDVLTLDPKWIATFDLVTASPPCQFASLLKHRTGKEYYNFIPETRDLLIESGVPYIIENVEAAKPHLINPFILCGTMFDLGAMCKDGEYRQLWRHRAFESNLELSTPGPCNHTGHPVSVHGGGGGQMTRGYKAHADEGRIAMGLDHYMPRSYNSQAIPPAYTEWLGTQALTLI